MLLIQYVKQLFKKGWLNYHFFLFVGLLFLALGAALDVFGFDWGFAEVFVTTAGFGLFYPISYFLGVYFFEAWTSKDFFFAGVSFLTEALLEEIGRLFPDTLA
jgi:hypothetical protein